jgi:uncharacterized membrane protein YidH (DUF202 family)
MRPDVPGRDETAFNPVVDDAIQRTDLAWVRSALTFGGVGVAILKGFSPIESARPIDGIIAIILGLAVVVTSAGYLRRRRNSDRPVGRSLLFVTIGTVSIGTVALIVGATR